MKAKILIVAMAAAIGFSPVAKAEDLVTEKDIGGKFSANVALVNEYFFRGITQSGRGNPAVQGGFDFAHNSGAYVGTWASSINFGGNVETDFYAGWAGQIGSSKVGLDVGAIYFHYPSAAGSSDLDYVEGYLKLSKDFGFAAVSGKVSASPDFQTSAGESVYLEGAADVPLGKYFTLKLHTGHQWIDNNASFGFDDYTDYSVGVGFGLFGFGMTVAWVGTDLPESQSRDDGRLMLMASRAF